MITSLGKFLRTLRMDHGELLRDMADKMHIAPSYLSSVENGKRTAPEKWISQIAELYKLNDTKVEELTLALLQSKKEINIITENLSNEDIELTLAFARSIENLDEKQKNKLRNILI